MSMQAEVAGLQRWVDELQQENIRLQKQLDEANQEIFRQKDRFNKNETELIKWIDLYIDYEMWSKRAYRRLESLLPYGDSDQTHELLRDAPLADEWVKLSAPVKEVLP